MHKYFIPCMIFISNFCDEKYEWGRVYPDFVKQWSERIVCAAPVCYRHNVVATRMGCSRVRNSQNLQDLIPQKSCHICPKLMWLMGGWGSFSLNDFIVGLVQMYSLSTAMFQVIFHRFLDVFKSKLKYHMIFCHRAHLHDISHECLYACNTHIY